MFKNYQYPEIRADLSDVVSTIRQHNPDVKMIFTVSPVPLVATASGNHVLPAVVYSKSTLRAVAGDIASADPAVDYFPSYEMISAFPFRGAFFEPNLRGVTRDGVDFVMGSFFEQLGEPSRRKPANGKDVGSKIPSEKVIAEVSAESGDLVCDEMILDEMRK